MEKPKILLIHGWNYTNYTSIGCVDAWADRSYFTEVLSKYFDVVRVNLPGFGGEKEPKISWTLDSYVQHLDGVIRVENPDFILGYSFGGAVVLHWKKITGDLKIKAFLVSPAIMRRYEEKDMSNVQRVLKSILPDKLISVFRDIYLTRIRKNPYYTNATKVMRETYRNIVAVDLRADLLEVTDRITLIYGELDTATPVDLVRETISKAKARHILHVIKDGGHDIANTQTEELVSHIAKEMAGVNES